MCDLSLSIDLSGVSEDGVTPDLLLQVDAEYSQWMRKHASGSKNPLPRASREERAPSTNSRKRRREEFAFIQRLWKKDRKKCADRVLMGQWHPSVGNATKSLSEFVAAWEPIFDQPSRQDQREVTCKGRILWSLMDPITLGEL